MSRPSWFAVDGTLEPIDFDGPPFFPKSVTEYVIEHYSEPADWIIDPNSGFGTTMLQAERLERLATGYGVPFTSPPWDALPFTSPPHGGFRLDVIYDIVATYVEDARRWLSNVTRWLAPSTTIAVEVSQGAIVNACGCSES